MKILSDIVLMLHGTGNPELALEIVNIFNEHEKDQQFKFMLGNLYLQLGDADNAAKCADVILSREIPQEALQQVIPFAITAYRHASMGDKSIELIDKVLENQKVPNLLIEKAGCLYEINKKEEACKILESIDDSELDEHDLTKKNTYYAAHQLRHNNFKEGMKGVVFEHDKLRKIEAGREVFHTKKELPLEFWYGTNDCKKLIVYAEAGLGDEIINIRFLKNLKAKGIDVKWYGVWHKNAQANKRAGAAEWFKKSGFDVITDFDPKKYKDYMWTYSQYLPILLDLDEKDLWTGPYLKAGKKRLPKTKKNIGIRWGANPYPLHRNIPVKNLYKALGDLKANFYSLQRDFNMEEIKDFPKIIDLSDKINDFNDTAAYINSFDLLITCPTCTSPAAGALDKENITIVQISDYYVFNTMTNKTPWFSDKMTLVRQQTPRRWDDIMDEVRQLTKEKLGL